MSQSNSTSNPTSTGGAGAPASQPSVTNSNSNPSTPSGGTGDTVSSSNPTTSVDGTATSNTNDQPGNSNKQQPKWKSREITLLGYDDCGGCRDAEHIINTQIKPNSDVETVYKKIIADSDEGKPLVKEKNIKYVPYIKECLIPTDPNEERKCTEYKDFKDYKYKLKVNTSED